MLEQIELRTDFVFAYSKSIEALEERFTFHYEDATLKAVLEDLSRQGNVEFKRINNTISVALQGVAEELPLPAVFTVSGRVIDEANEPVPGVNIVLRGTSSGTTTDMNGDYTIQLADDQSDDVLVFSFIGYTTVEEPIQGKSTINVTLRSDVQTLNEIVVIGYQAVEKRDLTGAVSVLNSRDVSRLTTNTVAESIQGLAAGVTVRNTGSPGAAARIDIRGTGTFGANEPLYVIDGMITNATPDFNPNDIESIQILKDASAAAIYGSRAANGVIIITTKRGSQGALQISGSVKVGVQEFHKRWDLLDASAFAALNRQAYTNAGLAPQPSVSTQFDPNINTDWQEELMRTGSIQDYNINLSGGGESSTYLISGNYFSNKGTMIDNSFERGSLRINTTAQRGRFSFGEFILFSYTNNDFLEGDPFIDMLRMLPTMPVQGDRYISPNNPEGWAIGIADFANTLGTNPVALQRLLQRDQYSYRVRGNAFAQVEILEGLNYKFNVGLETSFDHNEQFRRPGVVRQNSPDIFPTADESRGQFLSTLFEHTVNYDREFGEHKIWAVIGVSQQNFRNEFISGQRQNQIQNTSTGQYYTGLNQGINPITNARVEDWSILGYLGRINYSFADRYLFSYTFRSDADSRLSEDERRRSFNSASLAWRISNEDFFNSDFISDLKFRASYGELGNSEVLLPWQYQYNINPFPRAVFGTNQTVQNGAINTQLANERLSYEIKRTTNIGVDASFLDDKISLTLEYFNAETDDVLTQLPIPLTAGNAGTDPPVNAASLRNRGFELAATYRERENKLRWDVTLNLTTISNEVLELGNVGVGRNYIQLGDARTEIGRAIGEWYVLRTNGIFQNQQEIDAQGAQPFAQPGDIRYVDTDGNGAIDVNLDRQYAGSPWPDLQTGLVFNAAYGNFTFSMQWYGVFGNQIYNRPRFWLDRFDENASYRADFTPWTPENPSTANPRIGFGNSDQGILFNALPQTDRWLESGTYVRLRNL